MVRNSNDRIKSCSVGLRLRTYLSLSFSSPAHRTKCEFDSMTVGKVDQLVIWLELEKMNIPLETMIDLAQHLQNELSAHVGRLNTWLCGIRNGLVESQHRYIQSTMLTRSSRPSVAHRERPAVQVR